MSTKKSIPGMAHKPWFCFYHNWKHTTCRASVPMSTKRPS